MPTNEPVDWEARCGQLVTEAIRRGARNKTQIQRVTLERDRALLRVRELEAQVEKLRPAAEALRKSEQARETELVEASRKVRAARDEVRDMKAQLDRGRRGVIEDTIVWLRTAADRLPAEVPTAGLLPTAEARGDTRCRSCSGTDGQHFRNCPVYGRE